MPFKNTFLHVYLNLLEKKERVKRSLKSLWSSNNRLPALELPVSILSLPNCRFQFLPEKETIARLGHTKSKRAEAAGTLVAKVLEYWFDYNNICEPSSTL